MRTTHSSSHVCRAHRQGRSWRQHPKQSGQVHSQCKLWMHWWRQWCRARSHCMWGFHPVLRLFQEHTHGMWSRVLQLHSILLHSRYRWRILLKLRTCQEHSSHTHSTSPRWQTGLQGRQCRCPVHQQQRCCQRDSQCTRSDSLLKQFSPPRSLSRSWRHCLQLSSLVHMPNRQASLQLQQTCRLHNLNTRPNQPR